MANLQPGPLSVIVQCCSVIKPAQPNQPSTRSVRLSNTCSDFLPETYSDIAKTILRAGCWLARQPLHSYGGALLSAGQQQRLYDGKVGEALQRRNGILCMRQRLGWGGSLGHLHLPKTGGRTSLHLGNHVWHHLRPTKVPAKGKKAPAACTAS